MTTDTRSTRTISERLADYIVDLSYEDLPESIVGKAKASFCYHLGAALRRTTGVPDNNGASVSAERARQAMQVAFKLSGHAGGCTIVGESQRVDPLEAVFANAFLMNGLDDRLPPDADPPSAGAHPGIMIHPVAWAVGEMTQASGRRLISAIVAGYDTIGRLGRSMLPWSRRWPRRGLIFGPFGGAAAAAQLLKLSRDQTTHALGHAGQAGMGVAEGSEYLRTLKPLLARNGLMAATLAEAGLAAASTIVEGKYGIYQSFFSEDAPVSLDKYLATLGREFEIANAQTTGGKPFSSEPIELLEQLVSKHSLTPGSIATVDVVLPQDQEPRHAMREHALNGPEPNQLGRFGSLRFRTALIISDGRLETSRLDEPPTADLLAILSRVRLRFENGRPIRYVRVETTTTDGERYTVESERREPPLLNWEEWLAESAHGVLHDDQLARLANLIANLEHVRDVTEIMDCVTGRAVHV